MRICILFTLLVIMALPPAQPQTAAQTVPHPVTQTAGRTITIHIHHFVGAHPLQLFDKTYIDPFGEPFTIQRLRYYISKINISGTDHQPIPASDQSFLVDESDSASKTITFSTHVKTVQSLSFIIGVDSAANFGGVQTGDLDPAKGMFWTWNSGYIFAKLEGRSDSSKAPGHQFTWDIGGYKSPANASREITLTIPISRGADSRQADSANADPEPGTHPPKLQLNVDLLKWFDGRQPIHISEAPVCHQPGFLAMRIADNYAAMFSISP